MNLFNAMFKLLLLFPLISFAQNVKVVQTNEPLLDSVSIIGSYMRAFPPDFESGTLLILNADSTYLLKNHPDLREYSCHGKWFISENSHYLYLTSDNNRFGITEVSEKEDKSDSLRFYVEDTDGVPMIMSPIIVESGICRLDTLGIASIIPRGIRAFTIRDSFFGDCDYRYEVKNLKANVFRIKIKLKDQYYLYMKDLYWQIGVNVLYCPENGMLLMKTK